MWVRSVERVDGLEQKGQRTEWEAKPRGAGATTQSAKAKGGLLLPKGLLKSTSFYPEPPYSLVLPQLSLWLPVTSALWLALVLLTVAKVKSYLCNSWSVRCSICRLLRQLQDIQLKILAKNV